jgi:zinc transport system ATP-binding protein
VSGLRRAPEGRVVTVPGPAADTVLVSASAVAKSIAGNPVLSDVSIAVHKGEVVTVIGPNGAGKSTLLRVLMGVLKADAGTVVRRPGLTIGYVPQRMEIDKALPLTVARFLGLSCRDASRIREALAEVGASGTEEKPVQALSGGEFRRVALARAILRAPELLILDEPLAGVDVAGQAELYDLIGALRRRYGAGVLMVSHDLHLVMAETDNVVCLNHHVCCAGHPEAVSRDPAYAQLFGTAVAVYTHDHDHVHDGAGRVVALGDDHGVPDHSHEHGPATPVPAGEAKERVRGG